MMQPSRPAAFGILAVCSFLCACVVSAVLVGGGGDVDPGMGGRFGLGVTGALALVTAESLWFVRPWAFGTSLAFAGSFVATLFVLADSIDVFLVMAAVVALPILVALIFVHNGLDPARTVTPVRSPTTP
jgi:hypothetical protein